MFYRRENQRWFALALSPLLFVAAMVSPCGTCCAVENAAHKSSPETPRLCCRHTATQVEPGEASVAPGLHSCCRTSHDPVSHQHEGDGCDCCLGARSAWVVPKISEHDHGVGHAHLVMAIIDWLASADLTSVTNRVETHRLDEAPLASVPLRVLYCSWLI